MCSSSRSAIASWDRARRVFAFALLAATMSGPAAAEDDVIVFRESLFERFANLLEFHVVQYFWTPLCADDVTVDVGNFDFEIDAETVEVSGRMDAGWCGFSVRATMTTAASVTHDADTRSIQIETDSTAIAPEFRVHGVTYTAPFVINIGPTLSVPDIPLQALLFRVASIGDGDRSLQISADQPNLVQLPGRFELRGHVSLR